MTTVGIHLHYIVITVLNSPLKASYVGPAKALLRLTMQDTQLRMLIGKQVREVSGSIGRIVIDNQ
jgi:hypothetical protein